MRRILTTLTLVLLPLAFTATAAADAAAPSVTLLGPAEGTEITLDGKHDVAFAWRVEFPQKQTMPTAIAFSISTDPTFQGWAYTERHACPTSTPACFTGTTLSGTDWIEEANGGAPLSESGVQTLYWRVTVAWDYGSPATASATLAGIPALQDTTAPRLWVAPNTTAKRGGEAYVPVRTEDASGAVTLIGSLAYHGKTIFTMARAFLDVTWEAPYFLWFQVPARAKPGRYKVCIEARDPSENSVKRCVSVSIR